MSAAAAPNEIPADDERKAPPVSLAEVLAVCCDLEMEGMPVTRRSVRERLGRGSMTTIHNGVTEYESRREPPAPIIDLTQEDRSVIADLGARALAIAEGRVERILAEREAALQALVTAANARADDAIAAAEALVNEARHHTQEALAARETAISERDKAISMASEDRQRALRLEGQVEQLKGDKAAAETRYAELDAQLTSTRIQLAAEQALRQQRDNEVEALALELANIRTEYAETISQGRDALAWTKEALAAEQGRVVELLDQRIRSSERIERLEGELSRRDGALSKLEAAFAVSEATVAERERIIGEMLSSLSAEQAQAPQLTAILAAVSQQDSILRSLERNVTLLITDGAHHA